jgi:predicted ArsR family transcriptional regulator
MKIKGSISSWEDLNDNKILNFLKKEEIATTKSIADRMNCSNHTAKKKLLFLKKEKRIKLQFLKHGRKIHVWSLR